MAHHNLGTVISFEFFRTISRKRFWIGTLAFPAAIAVIFVLISISNSTTSSTADAQKSAQFSVAYTDDSHLISDQIALRFGATLASSPGQGIEGVKDGTTEAYFAFPADPTVDTIEVYASDRGIFENGKYSAVAQEMLSQAVQQKIGSAQLALIAERPAAITVITFQGATESGGLNSAIPPLMFILIFYGLMMLLAGQMVNSTLEEKENRVTEMILTTLKPTTLITGKVITLFLVGLVQAIVFSVPVVIGYLFFRDALSLPSVDLSHLIIDPARVTVGFFLLLGGFSLYTTTLVAVGAAMPTAKEAGSFIGVLMALIFVPLYVAGLVVSDPHSAIVQIFTYFPFSAPTTALLRNGLGTLGLTESIAVIALLFVCAGGMLRLAVTLFQYGSISYTKKVSLKTALARKSG
ncbi:ABC transporter permease [Nakamurella antarctica]|uniref:ABC transporter permease n=1 Tax=Nakamurella antarctica TaxID=1902245 RepID=A0A3G8ZKD6_9ACTN|nr:ABC transporter permease [Nakamurella antarctica]AZI57315.1 ABC transporter permease [Nakamurella antarctica]